MNTQFAVATHLLTYIAFGDQQPMTSEKIAASLNTHPALVRRMLSELRKAGLICTQLGPGGGARLARAPEDLSLLEVYDAISTSGDLFALNRLKRNPNCPLGAQIQATLECVLSPPKQALREALRAVSIRDVCQSAAARAQTAGAADTSGAQQGGCQPVTNPPV